LQIVVQVDCKSQECDLSFVDVLILQLVRVDPLVACSIVLQVFVTVVRSVTVCFCNVCESLSSIVQYFIYISHDFSG